MKRDEHRTMAKLVESASAADPSPLGELARLLADHVRFEERELYPACAEHLPPDVLDRMATAYDADRDEEGSHR
jgi:hypothetical protein